MVGRALTRGVIRRRGDMVENQQGGAFERIAQAVRDLDGQVREVRERFETRARAFQDELETRWQGHPLYERARELQQRIETQLIDTRSQLLARLGLVSRRELERLSERLEELARRLRELAEQKTQH
jgi:hypothetical protein